MFIIRRIDKLVLTSFLPPFVLAFFIAIFVLIMQFLWSFIDELVGKGIDPFDLFEMLFYKSLSLFPLAFPIAVLLASVMVFGGLAERYELSSMKSAGISLMRVMAAAIAFAFTIAVISLYFSNTLIPLSNLKFQSRLYDMRNQKPALTLAEGVFNDDFRGYSIYIGHKEPDNRRIGNVLIYDQTPGTRRQFNMVSAQRGEMFISEDQRDFVMKLYDGYHYQEVEPSRSSPGSAHAFTETRFSEWTKSFDLSEFKLSYTDEELFKSHHTMKSVRQLIYEIDTIDLQYQLLLERNMRNFRGVARHMRERDPEDLPVELFSAADTLRRTTAHARPADQSEAAVQTEKLSRRLQPVTETPQLKPQGIIPVELMYILDTISPAAPWDSVFARLPAHDQGLYQQQALNAAKSVIQGAQRNQLNLESVRINRAKHLFELHSKFSLAAICIIFLFIGAPMGAIVRKGGFGYPLLVSVIFFTIFILLTLMFKKLTETETVGPVLGAWMPCLIMLPIGALVTYKAMNDSKMLNLESWVLTLINFYKKLHT